MTFRSIGQVVDAELEGRVRRYGWRKSPSQTTTAGVWFDLSMSPGNPAPKYWFDAPPVIAKQVSQSADGGLFHGANVSPSQKVLRLVTAFTPTVTALPLTMILCDYLLYYPSCDDSTTDPQIMDNTITLPRYTDGKGVQMIAVSVAGRTGGQSFTVSYTNSDGVAGRTSGVVTQTTASSIGSLLGNSISTDLSCTPFIPLQSGDLGVRSIQSVTMNGADVGLFTLILVYPLGTTQIRGIDAPVEKDFLIHAGSMPIIYDNAYLSFIALPQGALNATVLTGDIKCIWEQ